MSRRHLVRDAAPPRPSAAHAADGVAAEVAAEGVPDQPGAQQEGQSREGRGRGVRHSEEGDEVRGAGEGERSPSTGLASAAARCGTTAAAGSSGSRRRFNPSTSRRRQARSPTARHATANVAAAKAGAAAAATNNANSGRNSSGRATLSRGKSPVAGAAAPELRTWTCPCCGAETHVRESMGRCGSCGAIQWGSYLLLPVLGAVLWVGAVAGALGFAATAPVLAEATKWSGLVLGTFVSWLGWYILVLDLTKDRIVLVWLITLCLGLVAFALARAL